MEQKTVMIGEIEVPIVIERGEKWYPVKYIYEKVLLRKGKVNLSRDKIKKVRVNFSANGGLQVTNCINESDLVLLLEKTQLKRLSDNQINAQDKLHSYLGMNNLKNNTEDEKPISKVEIYKNYRSNGYKRIPAELKNKTALAEILNYLFYTNEITRNNLTMRVLANQFGLRCINEFYKINEIYEMLFGKEFYFYTWKYPNYSFNSLKLNYVIANTIVNNYLKENEIPLDDIFNFDYEEVFRACRLMNIVNQDMLYFIVQFHQFKYAGYKFKTKSVNYYYTEANLLFDLKHLIEKDMHIHEDRIPLYLTKNNLQRYCRPLYQFIVTKRNGSIFEWVDKLYPNKYCREDFEINPYRNEFDSNSEMFIHDILVEEFGGNVIYNQRNNTDTIKLKNKVPDWFLFTEKGVWLVEYFGMYEKRYVENSRVVDYKNKMDDKLKTYQTLDGYRFLYIYREDIVNDYAGVREKIKKVKETLIYQG